MLAVQELENDGFGPDSAAASLLELLQATGLGNWQVVTPPGGRIGNDVITVGLFYRSDRLQASGPPRLLENQSLKRGRWIAVRLVGTWSNRDGYGAKVTVHAGGRKWAREVRTTNGLYSSHDPRLYFGLGKVERVDKVVVRWPDGATQTVARPALEHVLTVHENSASR